MRLHILPRDLKLDGLRVDPWRRREDGGWVAERHGSLFEVVVANRLDVDLVKAAPRYELRRDGVIEGRFGSDDEARGAVDKLRGAGAAQGQLFQAEPVSLHDRFGAVAEPVPGTRAFRPLSDVDVRAFGMASAMLMISPTYSMRRTPAARCRVAKTPLPCRREFNTSRSLNSHTLG